MPVYCYECTNCNAQIELTHAYSELADGLSDDTKSRLSDYASKYGDCENKKCNFERVMAFPSLASYGMKDRAGKARILKERAQDRFQKEGKEQKHEIMKDFLRGANKLNGR